MSEKNPYRALQFAVLDLRTGQVTPLVDAPIGRNLGHIAPTEAFWYEDNRHVVLTNTFLPVAPADDEMERSQRAKSTVAVAADIRTGRNAADHVP